MDDDGRYKVPPDLGDNSENSSMETVEDSESVVSDVGAEIEVRADSPYPSMSRTDGSNFSPLLKNKRKISQSDIYEHKREKNNQIPNGRFIQSKGEKITPIPHPPKTSSPQLFETQSPNTNKPIGRQQYVNTDNGPFLIQVSCLEMDPSSGTTIRPIKFGQFLKTNNLYKNIRVGSLRSAGRNRINLEFNTFHNANIFLTSPKLAEYKFKAIIPTYHITRMGVIRDIPIEWTEEQICEMIEVPEGCGNVIKARRLKYKSQVDGSPIWKPSQTVVVTLDGQVLPERLYCCFTSLPVTRYEYPTIQCYNCCRYGHTKIQCRSQPRCYKCTQSHSGDACTVTIDNISCLSCLGRHSATSKSCPEQYRQRDIKSLMSKQSISYIEASSQVPKSSQTFASVTALQSTSHRKTVFKQPKPRAPLTPGYDKQAHDKIINTSFSPLPNGCAFESKRIPSQEQSIIEIIVSLLLNIIQSQNLPSNVATLLNSLTEFLQNATLHSPPMERTQPSQQEG